MTPQLTKIFKFGFLCLLGGLLWVGGTPALRAAIHPFQTTSPSPPSRVQQAQVPPIEAAPPNGATDDTTGDGAKKPEDNQAQSFDEVVKNYTAIPGWVTLYRSAEENKAYLALTPAQLNQNLLLIATLESGIGEAGLFRGWPINDLLIQFRQAPGNKLHVVVPNLYFRNPPHQRRDQRLREQSFSDSTLFALDIVSTHPETGAMLIDLQNLMLKRDIANLSGNFPWVLGSYTVNPETSYLGSLKAFPENVEMEAVLGFSGGISSDPLAALFQAPLDSLPDPRGFNLRVRYSLSPLPVQSSYQPRSADERVGYFLTAYRSAASDPAADPFVRYIHRWHLEKQDPNAAISPPQQPIVFWLENTIPPAYRDAIREGVLMWNEAFERAGFRDALQVWQMPDDADWDPADVRYNVIRWSDSFRNWAIGLGPSRVNPLTGEILDADVVLDANVIRMLYQQYDTLAESLSPAAETYLRLCGHPFQSAYQQWLTGTEVMRPEDLRQRLWDQLPPDHADACAGFSGSQQMAFGALAIALLGEPFSQADDLDTYIQQYLRALTAHEVGHVLGLRHNFLGSTLLSPAALNDPDITRSRGMVSSVMDYFPPNIAPTGVPQGDYFPVVVGPYDLWAIEYGYKPIRNPIPQLAQQELRRVTQRGSPTELGYATDEDIIDFLDPMADMWDLSNNPLQYAEGQIQNARALWDKLNWYSVRPGEGYGQLRQRFDLVFNYYFQQASTMVNYVGGQRFTRTDPWASRGRPPFEPMPAEQQRAALADLQTYVFDPDAFNFSPGLLNSLAPDRWRQWGQRLTVYPLDYPIYDQILLLQGFILSDLLNADRLLRLRDAEFKATTPDAVTLAELFDTLGQTIWTEIWDESAQPTSISSLRRGLQRHHLTILTNMVLRGYGGLDSAQSWLEFLGALTTLGTPDDARVLARLQLRQIDQALSRTLERQGEALDLTTLAHLEAVHDRIQKTLVAPLQGS